MLRSDVAEILGKSEVRAMTGHLYRKATGNSLCGPASCVGWSLRVSPGQDKQCDQDDGDSDMAPPCWLC